MGGDIHDTVSQAIKGCKYPVQAVKHYSCRLILNKQIIRHGLLKSIINISSLGIFSAIDY